MLARLQQVIAFVLVAVVGFWVAWCLSESIPEVAPAAAALILVCYSAVLGIEFFLLYRSYRIDDRSRPSLRQVIGAWRAEVLLAPLVFLWRQPFRASAHGDYLPAMPSGSSRRRGVVLVHGFFCNRGIWNPWMRRLRERRIPFRAVDLIPIFGSIDAYTEIIADAVADVERATGRRPVIVGHSMGGLAARAWLASRRNVDVFYRVVTIASPHGGTALARRSRFENGRQMALGSAWLAGLAQLETAATRRRFVCFWSHCDNIVFPTRTATLVDADNRHLEATPHVQMIYHPEVFAEVVRLVDAADVDVDGAAFKLDGSTAQSALVSASTPRRT